MNFSIEHLVSYNKKLKIKSNNIECYDKGLLKRRHPDKDYKIIGETKRVLKSDEKSVLTATYSPAVTFTVSGYKSSSRLLYREAGYLSVGENNYIVVLKSRLAFLIWFLTALVILGTALFIILNAENDSPATTIKPLPDADENVVAIPNNKDEPSASGGNSISMSYVLEAKASLSTGEVGIYFSNPHKSNQDAVLELYIVNGNEEVLLATSGRIPRGNSLTEMTADNEALSRLTEGSYEAFYKIICYDSSSGAKALVEPKITDVNLTVIK